MPPSSEELEMGDALGLVNTYMLASSALTALGRHEAGAVLLGVAHSTGLSTRSAVAHTILLLGEAEVRSREKLSGDDRRSPADRSGRDVRRLRRGRLPPH